MDAAKLRDNVDQQVIRFQIYDACLAPGVDTVSIPTSISTLKKHHTYDLPCFKKLHYFPIASYFAIIPRRLTNSEFEETAGKSSMTASCH